MYIILRHNASNKAFRVVDMPKVIHIPDYMYKVQDALEEHAPAFYVGVRSEIYGPHRNYLNPNINYLEHAKFMKEWERGWIEVIEGKNLICDCNRHEDCHANILLSLANPHRQLELF